MLVRELQRPRHLGQRFGDAQFLLHAARTGLRFPVKDELVQAFRQAGAVDQLHAEEMLRLVLADLEDRHDAGVVQLSRRLRLLPKPLHRFAGGQLPGQDQLDGDQPVQSPLPRPVDDPHSPAGDLRQQLVVAELRQHPCRIKWSGKSMTPWSLRGAGSPAAAGAEPAGSSPSRSRQ